MNNRLANIIHQQLSPIFPSNPLPSFCCTSLSGTGGVVNNVGAGVICTTGILDPCPLHPCNGTGGVVPGNKLGRLPTIGILRATILGVKGSDATGATGATIGSTSGVGGRGVVARLVAEGEVNLGCILLRVFPKIGVFTLPHHPIVHRIFHYKVYPFSGSPIFGNT